MQKIVSNVLGDYFTMFIKDYSPDQAEFHEGSFPCAVLLYAASLKSGVLIRTGQGLGHLYNLELHEDVMQELLYLPTTLLVTKVECDHLTLKIPMYFRATPLVLTLDNVIVHLEEPEKVPPPPNKLAALWASDAQDAAKMTPAEQKKSKERMDILRNMSYKITNLTLQMVTTSNRNTVVRLNLHNAFQRSVNADWEDCELSRSRDIDESEGTETVYKLMTIENVSITASDPRKDIEVYLADKLPAQYRSWGAMMSLDGRWISSHHEFIFDNMNFSWDQDRYQLLMDTFSSLGACLSREIPPNPEIDEEAAKALEIFDYSYKFLIGQWNITLEDPKPNWKKQVQLESEQVEVLEQQVKDLEVGLSNAKEKVGAATIASQEASLGVDAVEDEDDDDDLDTDDDAGSDKEKARKSSFVSDSDAPDSAGELNDSQLRRTSMAPQAPTESVGAKARKELADAQRNASEVADQLARAQLKLAESKSRLATARGSLEQETQAKRKGVKLKTKIKGVSFGGTDWALLWLPKRRKTVQRETDDLGFHTEDCFESMVQLVLPKLECWDIEPSEVTSARYPKFLSQVKKTKWSKLTAARLLTTGKKQAGDVIDNIMSKAGGKTAADIMKSSNSEEQPFFSVSSVTRWRIEDDGKTAAEIKSKEGDSELRLVMNSMQVVVDRTIVGKLIKFMNPEVDEEAEKREKIAKVFEKYDQDNSGMIDTEEFGLMVEELTGESLTDEALENYVKEIDADGNGEVDFDEFFNWWKQTYDSHDKEDDDDDEDEDEDEDDEMEEQLDEAARRAYRKEKMAARGMRGHTPLKSKRLGAVKAEDEDSLSAKLGRTISWKAGVGDEDKNAFSWSEWAQQTWLYVEICDTHFVMPDNPMATGRFANTSIDLGISRVVAFNSPKWHAVPNLPNGLDKLPSSKYSGVLKATSRVTKRVKFQLEIDGLYCNLLVHSQSMKRAPTVHRMVEPARILVYGRMVPNPQGDAIEVMSSVNRLNVTVTNMQYDFLFFTYNMHYVWWYDDLAGATPVEKKKQQKLEEKQKLKEKRERKKRKAAERERRQEAMRRVQNKKASLRGGDTGTALGKAKSQRRARKGKKDEKRYRGPTPYEEESEGFRMAIYFRIENGALSFPLNWVDSSETGIDMIPSKISFSALEVVNETGPTTATYLFSVSDVETKGLDHPTLPAYMSLLPRKTEKTESDRHTLKILFAQDSSTDVPISDLSISFRNTVLLLQSKTAGVADFGEVITALQEYGMGLVAYFTQHNREIKQQFAKTKKQEDAAEAEKAKKNASSDLSYAIDVGEVEVMLYDAMVDEDGLVIGEWELPTPESLPRAKFTLARLKKDNDRVRMRELENTAVASKLALVEAEAEKERLAAELAKLRKIVSSQAHEDSRRASRFLEHTDEAVLSPRSLSQRLQHMVSRRVGSPRSADGHMDEQMMAPRNLGTVAAPPEKKGGRLRSLFRRKSSSTQVMHSSAPDVMIVTSTQQRTNHTSFRSWGNTPVTTPARHAVSVRQPQLSSEALPHRERNITPNISIFTEDPDIKSRSALTAINYGHGNGGRKSPGVPARYSFEKSPRRQSAPVLDPQKNGSTDAPSSVRRMSKGDKFKERRRKANSDAGSNREDDSGVDDRSSPLPPPSAVARSVTPVYSHGAPAHPSDGDLSIDQLKAKLSQVDLLVAHMSPADAARIKQNIQDSIALKEAQERQKQQLARSGPPRRSVEELGSLVINLQIAEVDSYLEKLPADESAQTRKEIKRWVKNHMDQ